VLSPCLKHSYGHGVGQVQTALAFQHGQAQALCRGEKLSHFGRKAACFAAKHKPVTCLELQRMGGLAAVRGHGKHAVVRRLHGVQKGLPVGMAAHAGVLVVVQPCAAHVAVFHGKAQGLNQVQLAASVGCQANDVACIRWNLRLYKNNMEHGGVLSAFGLAPGGAYGVRAMHST
jgi:hypothetical protein